MNKFYSYLFKKRLGLDVPVAKDKKQARNIFYELCDVLDDLERYKNAEKIS